MTVDIGRAESRLCAEMRVTDTVITPVAVKDPPLLNSMGVHQPYALRAIIQVHTDIGLTGLGETYGDDRMLERLRAVAGLLPGLDPFDASSLLAKVETALGRSSDRHAADPDTPTPMAGNATVGKTIAIAFSAFEVALLDIQGKVLGRPVCDLLGGTVRDSVPFSAYLFYKLGKHPGTAPYEPDEWGEVLDTDSLVAQARIMVERYGFAALKLKGGVFPPEQDVEAVFALREAFPSHPIRIDPNTAWAVATSINVGRRLEGLLEYLEDPTPGIQGMATVARDVPMPLATNMCVTTFGELPEAIHAGAPQVILSDHHYWGGLRRSQVLAGICDTFGLGLSMHSNSHLGISMAAMTHFAAATPNLTYACDTHTPWQSEDVITPNALRFENGSVPIPDGPGLGVDLDSDALARLHEQWRACGIRTRDDVEPMRAVDPHWTGNVPRF